VTPYRILVVCHANTARSVMAQALLERLLAERGVDGRVQVRSAGVARYARDGMLASLDARLALREVGVELPEHIVSTDLRAHPALLAEADLVVTMTVEQKRLVADLPSGAERTVVTLRELAGEAGDIADPAAQGEEAFRLARDEIARCLALAAEALVAAADGRAG
jgi:protein-tyrosine-phosphatase